MKSLLKKAKEFEKEYDWLQAAKSYNEASDLALKKQGSLKVSELQERLGYCYFKAADQAETNKEFRKLMKQPVQAYRHALKILEEIIVGDKQVRIDHVTALIALVEGVLEKNLLKKKKLLDEWWALENRVISAHEKSGDLSSAGRVCNELLEYSRSHRYWFVLSYSEWEKNRKEYINLAEKAIQIFSQLNDDYELARAYFLATYYHSFGFGYPEAEITQKAREYSKKALELSHKTGDPWLIGESYRSKIGLAQQDVLRDLKIEIENYKNAIKYGKIAKSNYVITGGNVLAAYSLLAQALVLEDPDEQKESLNQSIKLIQKAKHLAEITENVLYFWVVYRDYNRALNQLASIETDLKKRQELLELAIKVNQEAMERLEGWKILSVFFLWFMSDTLRLISKTKSEIEEKRKLLQKAKHSIKDFLVIHKEMLPFQYDVAALGYYQLAQVQNDIATIGTDSNLKIEILKRAVTSTEKAIEILKPGSFLYGDQIVLGFTGMLQDFLGSLLVKINLIFKDENTLFKAMDSYEKATLTFEKAEMPTHVAESNWRIAQIYDRLSEFQKASNNYDLAAKAYELSSRKMPQLQEFYDNYLKYMKAWSQIEQAKYFHSIEDYLEAKKNYQEAAKIYQTTDPWKYLAPNYSAWAAMEEAEGLSREENTQLAKQTFQKALEQFSEAEKSIKQKIGEIASEEEKELIDRLLQASDLRRRFCQARIQIEDAKLLDRGGKYLQSSKSYGEAVQKLGFIIEKIGVEAERKEMEHLTTLCQAWEKMAVAEERTSSESYLEAAEFFEKAKEYCYTKKANLWALGNSSFCRGLAAGIDYQRSLDLKDNALAKSYMKSAAASYYQAGFESAAEYAKATQRLFDAYIFMNQAESEVDPEKRAKQYQLAEKLLQIAAGSFIKAKQPEKTAQVQEILATVREEKALAASLNQVMQAPTIASSTLSFAAPTPTNEISVGLEQFQHANVQANLIASNKEVKVGESFCLSVEFVNAGKESALLTRVEDFVPQDFRVIRAPEIYRLDDTCLNMKGKQIAPLKLVEAKLVLQPSKKGTYQLKPTLHYLDELGQNKALQLKSVEIKVEEVILADRIPTGTKELDSLLLGGIPEGYAVVLTGPPSDERELIVRNFLKSGAKEGQTSFYVTTEAVGLTDILKESGFYLFLCNPKPKVEVPDLPNVFKLRSKTDINNLNMALARESRGLQQAETPKKLCIEIVSDVLLRLGPEVTRRWLSELITDLTSKGFVMLCVMDPEMHPADQSKAVLNLFDGEISITQTDDSLECKKEIQVKKLRGQDYIKNPTCLAKT